MLEETSSCGDPCVCINSVQIVEGEELPEAKLPSMLSRRLAMVDIWLNLTESFVCRSQKP